MRRKLSKTEGPSLFAALVAVIAAIALFGACAGPQGEKGDPGDPGIQGLTGDTGPSGQPATFFTVEFNLDGGDVIGGAITDEIVFGGAKVREPVRIPTKVADGTTLNMPAGLYSTTNTRLNHTFIGWYWDHDGDSTTDKVLFDFDGNTITADTKIYAGWGDPAPVEAEANNVAAAVAYINTAATAGEYILVLDPTPTGSHLTEPQQLTQNGVDLTIRVRFDPDDPGGDGDPDADPPIPSWPPVDGRTTTQPATIALSRAGILFDVGPATANGSIVKLTIGEKIILKGFATNNSCMVRIRNGGIFTLEEDAQITGNVATITTGTITNPTAGSNSERDIGLGAAVFVQNGTFTMQDTSTITGNSSNNSYYQKNTGGVYVANTPSARFIMEGTSSVNGNTTAADSLYDVFIRSEDGVQNTGSLTMKGGAFIGILGLESRTNNTTTPASVTIAGLLTGTPTHIRLWADTGGITAPSIANCWKTGAIVLRGTDSYNLVPGDVTKFVLDGLYGRSGALLTNTLWIITRTGAPTNSAIVSGR